MTYRWGVFRADLDPTQGSEQRGMRPVLVISDEDFNSLMPVVTILPITSLKEGRRVYPNEALLKKGTAGLMKDSIILAHQIRTISKARLVKALGAITEEPLRSQVEAALRVHLNL